MTRRRPAGARVGRWLTLSLVAGVLLLAPISASLVDELYSRRLYPWLQNGLTAASNMASFAVLDLLIALTAVVVLFRAVRVWTMARRRGVLSALWEVLRRLLRGVAVVAIVFTVAWGCNYRRVPLAATLDAGAATPATMVGLQRAVADANALGAQLRPALQNSTDLTYAEIAELLHRPMNAALARIDRPALSRPGRPKFSVVLTPFFTWAGVDGMINPLALESIVHPDLLPFERGFVLAHEWAHLAGQADEAEASAVGWLACMLGPPVFAYSASLYLVLEAAGSLPPDLRRGAFDALDPGVRADLDAIGQRMRRRRPEVQRAASQIYDQYLKANRVSDGTASYSRALQLILAAPLRDALDEYGTTNGPGPGT